MLRRLFLGLALLAVPAAAEAGSLNLVQAFPDITSVAPKIDYVAATDTFTVTDTTLSIRQSLGSPAEVISGGNYSLTALIDSNEVLGQGGTLSIDGTLGPDSGSLLTGELTAFGFTQSFKNFQVNATFEFLFKVTGGALAADFGGVGAQGGVIISASKVSQSAIGFGGNFNFNPLALNTATDSDTFAVVPEPASVAGLAIGLGTLGLGIVVRRRRAKA